MTQAQLDLARLGILVGCLQFSVSEAVARMNEQHEHADTLRHYRQELDQLAAMIGTGELRGSDAGQA